MDTCCNQSLDACPANSLTSTISSNAAIVRICWFAAWAIIACTGVFGQPTWRPNNRFRAQISPLNQTMHKTYHP